MKTIKTPLASLALTVCLGVTTIVQGGSSLILNGGFEEPAVSIDGWIGFFPPTNFGGWTVEFGGVDVTGTNFFASASGTQSLDLNNYFSGGVYQDLVTLPGESYRLRFAFGGNTVLVGDPSTGPAVKRMEVLWGTNILALLEHDVTGRSPTDVGWREFSFTVSGTGSDRVTFRSLTEGSAGPAIDDVSLAPSTNSIPLVDGLTIERAVRVCWPTVPGQLYQVQWAAQADTNVWTYLGLPIVGDGTTNCMCDPLGTNRMRIYRVLLSE